MPEFSWGVMACKLDSTSHYCVGQYKYTDGLSNYSLGAVCAEGLSCGGICPLAKNCPGFLQHIYQSWQPSRCSNRLNGRKGQHHREMFSRSAVIVLMPEPSHTEDLLDLFETVGLIPSAIRRIEPCPHEPTSLPKPCPAAHSL